VSGSYERDSIDPTWSLSEPKSNTLLQLPSYVYCAYDAFVFLVLTGDVFGDFCFSGGK